MACERFHKEVRSVVTERKPNGMRFETWVDRAIRDAEDAGKFADLPGAGKPIPGAGRPDDELWWVKAKMREEKLAFVPLSLALRKDVEEVHDHAATKRSEADVRQLVDDLNARIVAANRTGISGPPVTLMPLDPDRVLATWRAHRLADSTLDQTTRPPEPGPPWWRLFTSRRQTPSSSSGSQAGRPKLP